MSDFFFLLDHLVLAEPLSQEVVLRPRPAQLLGEGPVLPLKEGGPDGDLEIKNGFEEVNNFCLPRLRTIM